MKKNLWEDIDCDPLEDIKRAKEFLRKPPPPPPPETFEYNGKIYHTRTMLPLDYIFKLLTEIIISKRRKAMVEEKLSKEIRIEVMERFIKSIGAKTAASFVVSLQDAVEGLTKNNESFVNEFHSLYKKLNK